MQQTPWFERKFDLIADNGLFPNILERLSGTPARVEALFRNSLNPNLPDTGTQTWSAKQELGHLIDLEPLWLGRLHDFSNHLEVLREADLQNRKTHDANHNATPLETLLENFQNERAKIVTFFSQADPGYFEISALHPRLRTPMRPIDLAFFIAEHDDHHLVKIRARLKA
ncbi:MAG: DinB family protein [Saprospiraceae bacterium]|nr:DinB family protein [Saprospiraceae bacterium]